MNRRPPHLDPTSPLHPENVKQRPVLFIGGSRDGKWTTFPPDSNIWHAGYSVRVPQKESADGRCTLFTEEHYRPERFVSGQNERVLFVLQELSPEEILDRLIAGYKQGN